jgi:hypothetical protein
VVQARLGEDEDDLGVSTITQTTPIKKRFETSNIRSKRVLKLDTAACSPH